MNSCTNKRRVSQWCGVFHEMQFVAVSWLSSCVTLSNTCSQLAVDLQLVGEGGAIGGEIQC